MDKYDEQIAFLNKNPGRISEQWHCAQGLFAIIGTRTRGMNAGCLTMIRGNTIRTAPNRFFAFINNAANEELTREIENDLRLPRDKELITLDHLPVFAEWQRKIDKLKGP